MAKKTNKDKKTVIKTTIEKFSPKSTKVKSSKVKNTKQKPVKETRGSKTSKSTKTKTTSNKPKESASSRKRRMALQRMDKLKTQLAKRVKEANEIVEEYGDYEHLQPIFADAKRTLPPSRKNSGELFTTDIKSEQSMMRELARIDVFEAQVRGRADDDYLYIATDRNQRRQLTSAQQEKVTEIRRSLYKGAFGGQWMSKNDDKETYDKSRIVKDFAEEAFSIYSNLIEKNQSEDYIRMLWNKKLGKSQYDSENLIIAIYDMVATGWSRTAIEDKLDEIIDQLASDYSGSQFENPMDYEPL